MSLRDALGAQVEIWEGYTSDSPDVAVGFELAAGKLREVLAAHPVEPAPGVSDEAVEAAARLLFNAEWREGDWYWEQYPEPNRWQMLARQALEAALPYLQAQPVASRERVAEVLAASIAKQTILDGANLLHPRSADEVGGTFADALIAAGLFREPPTREQFAILLHSFDGFAIATGERWSDCNEDRQGAFLYQADAVLALIGGDAKS